VTGTALPFPLWRRNSGLLHSPRTGITKKGLLCFKPWIEKVCGPAHGLSQTTAESGNPWLQTFCPRCALADLFHHAGRGQQASCTVRAGILRQRDQFVPRRQNWFRSALPWVTGLAAVHKNEKQA
jgi:hypothetical protein